MLNNIFQYNIGRELFSPFFYDMRLSCIFLFFSLGLFGQQTTQEKLNLFENPYSTFNQIHIRAFDDANKSSYEEIFLYNSWKKAKIVDVSGAVFEIDSVNIYVEDFKVIFAKNRRLFNLDRGVVDKIYFERDSFKYIYTSIEKDHRPDYTLFKVLDESSCVHYLSRLQVREVLRNKDPMGLDKTFEKVQKEKFYVYSSLSQKLSSLPRKKKRFLKLFGKWQSKMKKYCKENRVSIKRQEDVIKTLKYYANYCQ